MFGVEALPLIHSYSQSDEASERAVFVRIYLDLLAGCARAGERLPEDWFNALQACLARSQSPERDHYLAELARAYLMREAGGPVAPSPPAEARIAFAANREIGAVLRKGTLEDLIALAADRKARLQPEHIAALAPRARALARRGDRRLADAVLSREPVRLEAAPLFLEAASEQRRAILLAAQRAELGRRAPAAPELAPETASRLEFAAIAGDLNEFAEVLAAVLGADYELAKSIAADPAGEPLAVALVALGAPRDVAVRVMTARDMQEGEGFPRIHALARLADQLSPAAARRILAALVGPARARATPAPSPASPRQAAHPSPFLRREAQPREVVASPETAEPKARNSQRP